MSYLNVGARDNYTNADIPTKKALKAAIAADPASVRFYVTDAFGPNANTSLTADKADNGVKYSVTGPNPYTSRKWYAIVEKLSNGTIKVS